MQFSQQLSRLCKCQKGGLAVVSAVAITALVFGAAIAVDYASMLSRKSTLQGNVDAAAIAVAREMNLSNSGKAELEAVANNMMSAQKKSANSTWTVAVTIDDAASSVEVAVSENWVPQFAHLLSNSITPITASATAKVIGSGKICVLALDDASSGTISLTKKAKLEANGCGVYSNSVHAMGLEAGNMNRLTAQTTCSAGGVSGPTGSFTPYPTTDCPPLPDPLIDRQPPAVGACDFNDHYAFEWQETLQPGIYCGGLTIAQNSVASLQPGIYIIKDGAFIVSSGGAAIGDNVAFYLVGDQSTFDFSSKATIELTAPKDGEMAGLLFFEDRAAPLLRNHIISSEKARLLLGTIYLPNGRLVVSTSKPVADQSAYTAIVARQIELTLNPTLVLNSDYSATNIPVPAALSGVSGRIVLAE